MKTGLESKTLQYLFLDCTQLIKIHGKIYYLDHTCLHHTSLPSLFNLKVKFGMTKTIRRHTGGGEHETSSTQLPWMPEVMLFIFCN